MDYFSPTDDLRVLVHSATHEAPSLTEIEPPHHFHFPPGFVSMVAAGAVLAISAGVHSEVQAFQARRSGHAHASATRHGPLHPRPEKWSAANP